MIISQEIQEEIEEKTVHQMNFISVKRVIANVHLTLMKDVVQ